MVIQSIAFLLFFKSLKIEKVSFSKLSPYIFGVYLLKGNAYAREFLWQKYFIAEIFMKAISYHYIIVMAILFLVIALIIEYLRINLWKKLRRIRK